MHIFGISIGIDRSSDKNTMTTVTAEERDRYLAWWQKFKILDRLNWFRTTGVSISAIERMGVLWAGRVSHLSSKQDLVARAYLSSMRCDL